MGERSRSVGRSGKSSLGGGSVRIQDTEEHKNLRTKRAQGELPGSHSSWL